MLVETLGFMIPEEGITVKIPSLLRLDVSMRQIIGFLEDGFDKLTNRDSGKTLSEEVMTFLGNSIIPFKGLIIIFGLIPWQ